MRFILTLLFLVHASICFGEAITIQPGLGMRLDEYLERLEGFGFSGQLLVLKNETIVLHKGYGLADRNQGISVTAETLFEIASISKQFTAAAILKLEMQGKLSTSDSVRKFFPEAPAVWDMVTVHKLLTHTARIEDDYNYYSRHPHLERDPYVEHILHADLLKDQEMIYSNDGYVLLAAIVEKVSGTSFEEFLTEEIFRPAGMADTGFITRPEKIAGPLAIGYGGTRSTPGPNWQNLGSTGVISHVADLYRWYQALQTNDVLSEKAREKFFAAHVKTDLPFDYGYGWWVETDPKFGKILWHSGNASSFSGLFRWYVDQKMLVILLTNLAIADFPGREILFPAVRSTPFKRILHGESSELPPCFVPPSDLALSKFEGTYKFQDGTRVKIKSQNDSLSVLPYGQRAFNRFLPPEEKTTSRLAEFTQKTETLLQSLSKNDFSTLKEFAGDEEAFPGGDAFDVFLEQWKALGKKHGALIRFDVLGSTIVYKTEKNLRAETISLQTYENGQVFYRWIWSQDHLSTALPDLPIPVIPPFRNQSAGSFVNYHLFLNTSTRLEFDVQKGEVVAFVLHDERAEKISWNPIGSLRKARGQPAED
jgi:CubicO group peptidase (beta-lactamase class C family)